MALFGIKRYNKVQMPSVNKEKLHFVHKIRFVGFVPCVDPILVQGSKFLFNTSIICLIMLLNHVLTSYCFEPALAVIIKLDLLKCRYLQPKFCLLRQPEIANAEPLNSFHSRKFSRDVLLKSDLTCLACLPFRLCLFSFSGGSELGNKLRVLKCWLSNK